MDTVNSVRMTSLKNFCETRTTLYITHSDCHAKVSGDDLTFINEKTKTGRRLQMSTIRRVVFMGIPGFDGEVMYRLCKAGIPVDFLDLKGQPLGQLMSFSDKSYESVLARQEEFVKSDGALELARSLLLDKLFNSSEVLRRRFEKESLQNLLRCSALIAGAKNANELRGAEGISAKYYFDKWHDLTRGFEWKGRRYHPASDPVNVMLSVGYNLLYNRMVSALRAAGLNARVGFFHAVRGSHCALASDLMEPFRAFVDAAVLKMISLRQITPDEFSTQFGKCSITGYDTYRTLLNCFEKMFSKDVRLYRLQEGKWEESERKLNDHIDDLAFSYRNHLRYGTALHAVRARPCRDF